MLQALERRGPVPGAVGYLLAYCGPRIGEALALRVGDVDLRSPARSVRVSRTWTSYASNTPVILARPKTPAGGRVIPFVADDVAERLQPLVAGRDPEAPLFCGERCGFVHPSNFRRHSWTPARHAAGLGHREGLGSHALRHDAVSQWLAAGIDRYTVAEVAGHRSVGVTDRSYAHSTVADDAERLALQQRFEAHMDRRFAKEPDQKKKRPPLRLAGQLTAGATLDDR
jgi:integrase